MTKLYKENKSIFNFLNKKSLTKEQGEEITKIFDIIPEKKVLEDEFKIINDNINIIREKYSDGSLCMSYECLSNLSIITKKINDLIDNREIEYPIREVELDKIVKMVLDYYKRFSERDYTSLQKKITASGDLLLDWNMLKTIQGDKTLNIYPTMVHQFRHIIEDDYRSESYNVLSNTLAIFNEIDSIDDISKNNPEYSILKYKRIRTLENISLFMNKYIKIVMSNEIVDKKLIEFYFKDSIESPKDFQKILSRMYDLNSFQTDIKNIISTLKAIELSAQFYECDAGEVKLELDTIFKTFKGEEITITNDKKLNNMGAALAYLIDNMEYYEDYVNSLRTIKLDKVK